MGIWSLGIILENGLREHTRLKVVTTFDCKTWVPTHLGYSVISHIDLHNYFAVEPIKNYMYLFLLFSQEKGKRLKIIRYLGLFKYKE